MFHKVYVYDTFILFLFLDSTKLFKKIFFWECVGCTYILYIIAHEKLVDKLLWRPTTLTHS